VHVCDAECSEAVDVGGLAWAAAAGQDKYGVRGMGQQLHCFIACVLPAFVSARHCFKHTIIHAGRKLLSNSPPSLLPCCYLMLLLFMRRGASFCCSLRERRRCVVVLLCGTSGSGKSTLASILVRLQPPDGDQLADNSALLHMTVLQLQSMAVHSVQMQCCVRCLLAAAHHLALITTERHGCAFLKSELTPVQNAVDAGQPPRHHHRHQHGQHTAHAAQVSRACMQVQAHTNI
jgi:hypothetical protein